jgi:hypothetical protein
MKDINDAAIRNGAIIELQEKILAARESQSALLERISELEKEVASFETWNAEKQDYEMKVLASGAITYAMKKEAPASKPPHYICANCYENRKKRFLQKKPGSTVQTHLGIPMMYVCSECQSEIIG